MYKYEFSNFKNAQDALKIARRVYPNSYWYITNEYEKWNVVKSYDFSVDKKIKTRYNTFKNTK